MKWEYNDYRPQGFESYSTKWGNCELTVYQIGENSYGVGWYQKGYRVIKQYVDAHSFTEAQALAVGIVSSYLGQTAAYWRDMKNDFTRWVEEN